MRSVRVVDPVTSSSPPWGSTFARQVRSTPRGVRLAVLIGVLGIVSPLRGFASPCVHPATNAPFGLYGDLNGSGTVNIADAVCGLLAVTWMASPVGPQPSCLVGDPVRADLNCDGVTQVGDAVLVAQVLLMGGLPVALDPTQRGCHSACVLSCTQCAAGTPCNTSGTCASGVCAQNACAAPSCSDLVQNGAETDVDCGGGCPGCEIGESCEEDTDCALSACLGGECVEVFEESCWDILQAGLSTGDGFYTVDTDGFGPAEPFSVYCDMTHDGGGWALLLKIQGNPNPSPGVEQFRHGSPLWLDDATLLPTSPAATVENAKYPAYLRLPIREVRVSRFDVQNSAARVVYGATSVAPNSLRNFIQTSGVQFPNGSRTMAQATANQIFTQRGATNGPGPYIETTLTTTITDNISGQGVRMGRCGSDSGTGAWVCFGLGHTFSGLASDHSVMVWGR